MEIKTDYNIGEHIWIVYERDEEVCVYDDYITEICVTKDDILYLSNLCSEDIREEDIILYDNSYDLINAIKKLMARINEKTENN